MIGCRADILIWHFRIPNLVSRVRASSHVWKHDEKFWKSSSFCVGDCTAVALQLQGPVSISAIGGDDREWIGDHANTRKEPQLGLFREAVK
jgi:hypothetical protein